MEETPKPLIIRVLHGLEDGALVACLTVMILMAFGQIVLRNLFSTGIDWADAFLRYLVLWVGLLGAMVATREDNHINIDILGHLLKGRPRQAVRVVTDLFAAVVCLVLTYASVRFLLDEREGGALAFGSVPNWVAELILPVAFAAIGLRYCLYFVKHLAQAIKGTPPQEIQP